MLMSEYVVNRPTKCTWRFQFLDTPEDVSDSVIESLGRVFSDGFGLPNGWNREDIRRALHRSDVLGLLHDADGVVVGYAFYSAPEISLEGRHLLWEDAICLQKLVQGSGYTGQVLFKSVTKLFPERVFGWVGGRTQNPKVFLRYAKLGQVLPFDLAYTSSLGRKVMNFLVEHITEVQEALSRGILEQATGICRGIYREGKLGDYEIASHSWDRFEVLLRSWAFDRDSGDALLVVICLLEPFILIEGDER